MPALSDKEIEDITERVAERVAEKVVPRILTRFGIDVENPIDTQADMQFLRSMRNTHSKVFSRAVLIFVGILVAAGTSVFWSGLKGSFGGDGGN